MKIYIFDKNNYSTYKNFYEEFSQSLHVQSNPDFETYENLCYSADMLEEYLWYIKDENIHIILKNFDLEKIKNQKNYEDYEWNIILGVLNRFIEKYPNNKLEFIND